MTDRLAEIRDRHEEQVQPGKMVPLEMPTFAQALDDRGWLLKEVFSLWRLIDHKEETIMNLHDEINRLVLLQSCVDHFIPNCPKIR